MKKRVLIILFVLPAVLLVSCLSIGASLRGNDQLDPRYTVEYKGRSHYEIADVTYEGLDFLKSKEDQDARLKMAQPNYSKLPQGGAVKCCLYGTTVDNANPKGYSFIITDSSGTEIVRQKGRDETPEHEAGQYGNTWKAIEIIFIQNEIKNFPIEMKITRFDGEFVEVIISKI